MKMRKSLLILFLLLAVAFLVKTLYGTLVVKHPEAMVKSAVQEEGPVMSEKIPELPEENEELSASEALQTGEVF